MVERRHEIGRRVAIIEVVAPAWLAPIGMDEGAAEHVEIT